MSTTRFATRGPNAATKIASSSRGRGGLSGKSALMNIQPSPSLVPAWDVTKRQRGKQVKRTHEHGNLRLQTTVRVYCLVHLHGH